MGFGKMVTSLKKFRRRMLLRLFLKKITGQVNRVLNGCCSDWFYDFGTLLEIVRDSRLIRWDREIDAGVLNAEVVLAQKYGENRRVPDPGWRTIQSPTIAILTSEDIVTDSAAAS